MDGRSCFPVFYLIDPKFLHPAEQLWMLLELDVTFEEQLKMLGEVSSLAVLWQHPLPDSN